MKQKDFNEGLNHIDVDLVEEFIAKNERIEKRKRSRGILIRVGALAACLCLIVGAVVYPLLKKKDMEPTPDVMDIDGIPIIKLQAPSAAPQHYTYGSGSTNNGSGGASGLIIPRGICVTARLKEVLSDTYTFYDDFGQTEFRLLKMETVTLHHGEEMTDEFYYIVPVDYMTDFTAYSTFVIHGMNQCRQNYFVLYNTTKACPEAFDLILFEYSDLSWFGNFGAGFMAFDENGNLDMTLWNSTDAWRQSTERYWEEYQGYTLSQMKEDCFLNYTTIYLLENLTEEAEIALKNVKSFENSLYVPHDGGSYFTAIRYINGFATNEEISIELHNNSLHDVSRYKVRFTDEDLSVLPDLPSARAAIIEAFEKGRITPPHIQSYEELKKDAYSIYCWYAKTDTGVLGVIRVNWKYTTETGYYKSYYDDAYYIIEYGSNVCEPIDRDALLERLGGFYGDTSYFVYRGLYNETGKYSLYE